MRYLWRHGFCCFYKPEGMVSLERFTEGFALFFIFQKEEEGGAGAGHEHGAGECAEGAGGFAEDGMGGEEGAFEVVGQGGKKEVFVSCFQGLYTEGGGVFRPEFPGIDGGVGFGGGDGDLGADNEKGEARPGGKGGEFFPDTFTAGDAGKDAEGDVGTQSSAQGGECFRGVPCFIEGGKSPEDGGSVGGAAAHACFGRDFLGKGHGDAAYDMAGSKEMLRRLHHEVVPARRGAALQDGKADGVRLFEGDGVMEEDGVHDGVNVMVSVRPSFSHGQGEIDFCIGCFLYHFMLLVEIGFLYYSL